MLEFRLGEEVIDNISNHGGNDGRGGAVEILATPLVRDRVDDEMDVEMACLDGVNAESPVEHS